MGYAGYFLAISFLLLFAMSFWRFETAGMVFLALAGISFLFGNREE